MKFEYIVKKNDEGKKVKELLKDNLYVSSILLRKLRENKKIYVNDIKTFTNYLVKENDVVSFLLDGDITTSNARFEDKFKLIDLPLDILYEDDYLLIVNKDKNMPIHPSCNNYENTLSNIVAAYLKKKGIYNIHIVTRLDHNTTGICIFAKNAYIQELFIRKKNIINIEKIYTAICYGILENEHAIIEKNIARKKDTIILREVNKNGEFAKTEYFVKQVNKEKNYTVLKILLHTGRTHQIRVHMSYINHPLLGDELYANECGIENISKYITRQALHSSKIVFNHPVTNTHIEIVSPIPDDMQKLIDNCN